jgi:hypothetical protein
MRMGMLAAIAVACALAATEADAGTLKRIYDFCPDQNVCIDGQGPVTVAVDAAGNIFGTTFVGGANGDGVVFELVPDGSHWDYQKLHDFCADANCADGRMPTGSLVLGGDGSVYGVANEGGHNNDGVVFALKPNKNHTAYDYDVIYTFCPSNTCSDGFSPSGGLTYSGAQSGAVFDKKQKTPLYGLTASGGAAGAGVAYQLVPGKKGKWNQKVIHDFCNSDCADGAEPLGRLLFTSPNTLVGVANSGGNDSFGGTVFQLTANAKASKWKASQLFAFDGHSPNQTGVGVVDGVIMDAAGHLFGTTDNGSPFFKGVLYELIQSGKTWSQTVLHDFCQVNSPPFCDDGAEPVGLVPVMDAAGDIYGTSRSGGGNQGSQGQSGAGTIWKYNGTKYSVAYAFCGQSGCSDGDTPVGVVMDGAGNLIGATNQGGTNNRGLIYEFTP